MPEKYILYAWKTDDPRRLVQRNEKLNPLVDEALDMISMGFECKIEEVGKKRIVAQTKDIIQYYMRR